MRRWPALLLSLWLAVVLAVAPIGVAWAGLCDAPASTSSHMRHGAGMDAVSATTGQDRDGVDAAADHPHPGATDHACCVSTCVGQAVLPEVSASEAFVLHRVPVVGVEMLPEGRDVEPPLGPPRGVHRMSVATLGDRPRS